MKEGRDEIQTRLSAVHAFSTLLVSTPFAQTDERRMFNEQLLQSLEIYGWEMERQLAGHLANHEWFGLIALASILTLLLQDELLELNPELRTYRTGSEPTTAAETTARLISDALTQFERSQIEMAAYLQKPVVPGVLTVFIDSIFAAQANQSLAS